jgi:hypothetical protein
VGALATNDDKMTRAHVFKNQMETLLLWVHYQPLMMNRLSWVTPASPPSQSGIQFNSRIQQLIARNFYYLIMIKNKLLFSRNSIRAIHKTHNNDDELPKKRPTPRN